MFAENASRLWEDYNLFEWGEFQPKLAIPIILGS